MAEKKPYDQLSKQRKWQLKKAAEGMCANCGKPRAGTSSYCLNCLVRERSSYEKKSNRKQYDCKSRRIERGLPD